jgi:hypothetical protein
MQNASPPLLIMLNAFPPLPISFSLSRMQQSIGSAKNQSQICLQIPRQHQNSTIYMYIYEHCGKMKLTSSCPYMSAK